MFIIYLPIDSEIDKTGQKWGTLYSVQKSWPVITHKPICLKFRLAHSVEPQEYSWLKNNFKRESFVYRQSASLLI